MKKGKRFIKFLFAIYCMILILSSCSNQEEDIPYVPVDEISSTGTLLIPDKMTKTVNATINFKNLDQIDHLLVSLSGGISYSEKIAVNQLSQSYTYRYQIRNSDPESFSLKFKAVYKNGNYSKDFSIGVDNRWGFFIRKVNRIGRITGSPMEGEMLLNPNNTSLNWNVGGTDLGIIWEMNSGKYGIFFGDTFGRDFKPNASNPGPNGGSWRSNVLAFSEDKMLEDGLTINSMVKDNRGDAREIIYSAKDVSGNGDWTSIPTAAIRANGVDYVHYFNMRNWTGWITNYSGFYKSSDNGLSWSRCEGISFSSESPFGQVGFFKKEGFIYMIGTQTGRDSKAYLARFLETDIENIDLYEYWNGTAMIWQKGDEDMATAIIDDKVGELSFIYNENLNMWIIAYFNGDRYNITMRTAENITGPWSSPYELVAGKDYAQLYGSYIHPISVNSNILYFTMSMWLPYNVFLMKAELANMGSFSNK